MEPKPSPTGGELQSHRGGGTGRLVLLGAAPQAKPGPGGGGAAGGGAQARTQLPPSHDPPPDQRLFKKPPCAWPAFSACGRKEQLNPKYFHVNLSLDLILKPQMIVEVNTIAERLIFFLDIFSLFDKDINGF